MNQITRSASTFRRRSRAAATLSILCCIVPAGLGAQPTVRITSPPDRTVVHPGQTVQVEVAASGKFRAVGLIPWHPIPDPGPSSGPPYKFTLHIPSRGIDPGPYKVTAIGVVRQGWPPGPLSEITLQVEEPANAPMTFDVDIHFVLELHPGDTEYPINTTGSFPDGRIDALNSSIYTSFKSNAPAVATVDRQGVITAVAPGKATIIVRYRNKRKDVSVVVLPK